MYGSGSVAGSTGACTMKMLTARVCTASRSLSVRLGSVSNLGITHTYKYTTEIEMPSIERVRRAISTHLDERLAADAVELVPERSQAQQRVDVAGVQNIVELTELDRGLHRGIHRA